jgi:hypothetical protein
LVILFVLPQAAKIIAIDFLFCCYFLAGFLDLLPAFFLGAVPVFSPVAIGILEMSPSLSRKYRYPGSLSIFLTFLLSQPLYSPVYATITGLD